MRLLLTLLIFLLDVWAIARVLGSRAAGPAKAGWIAAILLLPVIGVVAWLLLGPGRGATLHTG